MTPINYGAAFKQDIQQNENLSLIGVYDVFSAGLAGRYGHIFVSGFGFAASHYGLPDISFIAWPDIVDFVRRIRHVLPHHHILVDIDDGYCDPAVAVQVVKQMEVVGASAVKLEDQKRPRKCGHFDEEILELHEYLDKLEQVLEARRNTLVVARTDATDKNEILRRVGAFSRSDADIVLADGMKDLGLLRELKAAANGKPLLFNQIFGGKSPPVTIEALKEAGVSLVIYSTSTPCLFATQSAICTALDAIHTSNGRLPTVQDLGSDFVGVPQCTSLLMENLKGIAQPVGEMFGYPFMAAEIDIA